MAITIAAAVQTEKCRAERMISINSFSYGQLIVLYHRRDGRRAEHGMEPVLRLGIRKRHEGNGLTSVRVVVGVYLW